MTYTFATTNLVIEASIEGNKLWVADFSADPLRTPDRVFALLQAPARLFHNWRDLTEWCLERRVVIEQAFQLGPELSDEERGARRPAKGFEIGGMEQSVRYEIPNEAMAQARPEFAEVDEVIRERSRHDKDAHHAQLLRKLRDELFGAIAYAVEDGLVVNMACRGDFGDGEWGSNTEDHPPEMDITLWRKF